MGVTSDPFLLPMGPDVYSISLSSDYITASSTICVTVSFKQNTYVQSDTTLSCVIINVDSGFIDDSNVRVISFMVSDYDNDIDNDIIYYNLIISLDDMEIGQHILHIQGIDSIGYTGPMSSIFFDICDPIARIYDKRCKDTQDKCEN